MVDMGTTNAARARRGDIDFLSFDGPVPDLVSIDPAPDPLDAFLEPIARLFGTFTPEGTRARSSRTEWGNSRNHETGQSGQIAIVSAQTVGAWRVKRATERAGFGSSRLITGLLPTLRLHRFRSVALRQRLQPERQPSRTPVPREA